MKPGLQRLSGLIAAAAFGASVWYVIVAFQWRDVWQVLKSTNPTWLLLAAATIPSYWLLRAVRWHGLLQTSGHGVTFVEFYTCVAASLGLATVTPFQSGEIMKVELLRLGGGVERLRGYSSFLVERGADLSVVVALAGGGLLLGSNFGIGRRVVFLVLAAMLLALVTAIVLLWNLPLRGWLGSAQSQAKACLPNVAAITFFVAVSIACWAITALGWHSSLRSIGVAIRYVDTVTLMCSLALVGILTFIPDALGVGEATAALLLTRLGQSAPQAQAGALILRFYGIMIVVLALGHFVLWQRLRRIRHEYR